MNVISYLTGYNRREDSSKVSEEDVSVELTQGKTDLQEEGSVVAPEIVATAEDKQGFESLVGRIFLHREGDSTAKTWTVRVLGALLLPLTLLTGIFDAGRFAAYKAGYCNGKSYSLIDMTSSACIAAAETVKAAYNSYMHPVKTIEEQNEETKKQVQKLSKELVEAYEGLNASHFSDPKARKSEQRIPDIQQRLIDEMNAYVVRNSTSTKEFSQQVEKAKSMVAEQIEDAAGNRVYIQNKVERLGPPSSLAKKVMAEFDTFCDGKKTQFSLTYSKIARESSDVVTALQDGVTEGHLTQEEAVEAIGEHLGALYDQHLEDGLASADTAVEDFLGQATSKGLLDETQAASAHKKARADVSELASAAAKDVVRTLTEETTDQEVDHQLIKAAEKLVAQGLLSKEDESQFLAEAKDLVQVDKEKVQLERLAKLQQEQEAKEALDLQKAAATQQAELVKKQGELMGTFSSFLDMIKGKQKILSELHQTHDALKEQLDTTRSEYMTLQSRTTEIKGKKISMLEAAAMYHAEVGKISALDLPAAERKAMVEELSNQGFSEATIDIIQQLDELPKKFLPILAEVAKTADQITVLNDEVKEQLGVYTVFRNNNIGVLEEDQKEVVVTTEKEVELMQKRLDSLHDKLFRVPYIQRIRGKKANIEIDPELNRDEVAKLLRLHEEKQYVTLTVDPAPSKLSSMINSSKEKLSGVLSYIYSSKKSEEVQQAEVVEIKV